MMDACMDLLNIGVVPQHYTVSQIRRSQLETLPLWKLQNLWHACISACS